MKYKEYLKTTRWQTLRSFALKRDDNRCRVCSDSKQVEVHHRTYGSINTQAELDDTITLCHKCHDLFHFPDKFRTTKQDRLCMHLGMIEAYKTIAKITSKVTSDFIKINEEELTEL